MKNLVSHPKALILDDDPIILEILNTAVEITEIFDSIVQVSSYKDAKSALAKDCFGLMIIDHHLPDGNGYQLLSDLRHNPSEKNCNVPTLFTTGAIEAEMEKELKSLPLVHFLPKPYVIENVVEVILDLLKLR